MTWSKWLLALALVFIHYGKALETKDVIRPVFQRCDSDKNGYLDGNEFHECILAHFHQDLNQQQGPLVTSDQDVKNFFRLVDRDGNKRVSLEEYRTIFTRLRDPRKSTDPVIIKTRDGKTKTVEQEDLFDILREQTAGFRQEGDRLLREEEKQAADLLSLEKDNPALAKIIQIGQWAWQKIQESFKEEGEKEQTIRGTIHRLRSLTEEKEEKEEGEDGSRQLSLELVVRSDDAGVRPRPRMRTFHVRVEISPRSRRLLEVKEIVQEGGGSLSKKSLMLFQASPSSSFLSTSWLTILYLSVRRMLKSKLNKKVLHVIDRVARVYGEDMVFIVLGAAAFSCIVTLLIITYLLFFTSFSSSASHDEEQKKED
eukprot:gene3179-3482_t